MDPISKALVAALEGFARQEKIPVIAFRKGRPGQLWFDKTAFAAPAANRFGNVGGNRVRGPGYSTVDFSVFRTFPITERARFEVRGEAFNLTNSPAWDNPNGSVSSGLFGQSRSATGQRQIQLGARRGF